MDYQPNVLLIVLDACRSDHIAKYAPTLTKLGANGVQFTDAVAPATWTQPSHASMFTGKYPHAHGFTQPSQSTGPTGLMDQLEDRGYCTHGVSGNGFVSPLWGYETAFDTFRYTQTPEPFQTGLDTYTYLRNDVKNTSRQELMKSVLTACLRHDHPIRSLGNLLSVGVNAASRRYVPKLTRIPHQTFAPNPQYTYAPEKNTKLLREVIRNEADNDAPFFAFANYMDTHRPYDSPAEIQRKYLGKAIPKAEFERLNNDVAAPWEFIRLVQNNAVDDDDIKTLQKLYAASVETVDHHIAQLIEALENNGIREETIVVIVGDHGENLGETDDMGRMRFGHEASVSENLARVPFVISHPDLEDDIDDLISVKSVFDLLMQASDPDLPLTELKPRSLVSEQVLCEYPALGDESFYDAYPDIDASYLKQRVSIDSVAAYQDDWRVVIESDGTQMAFEAGDRTEFEAAPSELINFARGAIDDLSELSNDTVAPEIESRLSELGYM